MAYVTRIDPITARAWRSNWHAILGVQVAPVLERACQLYDSLLRPCAFNASDFVDVATAATAKNSGAPLAHSLSAC